MVGASVAIGISPSLALDPIDQPIALLYVLTHQLFGRYIEVGLFSVLEHSRPRSVAKPSLNCYQSDAGE